MKRRENDENSFIIKTSFIIRQWAIILSSIQIKKWNLLKEKKKESCFTKHALNKYFVYT